MKPEETWQPVPGYEKVFEFSNYDNIRFLEGVDKSKVEFKELKVKQNKKKTLKPNVWKPVPFYPYIHACSRGYVRVMDPNGNVKVPFHSRLNKKAFTRVQIDGKTMLVHRLVAAAWHNVKGDEYIKFIDGNRCNLKPSNLKVCTKSECQENETQVLSYTSASLIRDSYSAGKTVAQLAKHWDVSRSLIYKILGYKIYIPPHYK